LETDHSAPISLNINNNTINKPNEVVQKFNECFCNISKSLSNSLPVLNYNSKYLSYLEHPNKHSIFLNPPSSSEIFNNIQNMNIKKSSGFDDISPMFLSIIASIVSPYLAVLFSYSFKLAIFPDCLKIAKVIPLHISGARTELTNYRPISLLSCFSKILEKLISIRILKFFDKHKIIYNRQFGFRKLHSPSHAIFDIITQCYENLENRKNSCQILLDIKKAFDTINHNYLLQKMWHYEIRGIANDLLKSYLQKRLQFVESDYVKSSLTEITGGVS